MSKFISSLILCLLPLISISYLSAEEDCSKLSNQEMGPKVKETVLQWCEKVNSNQKEALEKMADFRYCDGNYIFAFKYPEEAIGKSIDALANSELILLVHPIRRIQIGKNMTGYRDQDGAFVYREFTKAAIEKGHEEGAWVTYKRKQESGSGSNIKKSFIKKCGDHVIIGSGYYDK